MLSCRDFAHRHASDYLDDQLGWRARLRVRFHLLLCDHCRRFISQLSKVRALLRKKSGSNDAIDLAARIDPALQADPRTQELAAHLAETYEKQKKSSPPL